MARAGYDPRQLAHMFETIEKESSSGDRAPQWMSSHPDPGNRTQYITREAEALTIATAADEREFEPVKAAFASLPPAKTMGDLARAGNGTGGQAVRSVGTPGQPVPPPSPQLRQLTGGRVFQAAVPSDWTSLVSSRAIKVVPQNGYGQLNGQTVFSHGVEFGIVKAASRDLREATDAWLKAVSQGNPELRPEGEPQPLRISQRSALSTPFTNRSPLGGRERLGVYTTFLADGNLFYCLTVVPENEADAFGETFQRVVESIRLTDVH